MDPSSSELEVLCGLSHMGISQVRPTVSDHTLQDANVLLRYLPRMELHHVTFLFGMCFEPRGVLIPAPFMLAVLRDNRDSIRHSGLRWVGWVSELDELLIDVAAVVFDDFVSKHHSTFPYGSTLHLLRRRLCESRAKIARLESNSSES